MSPDAGWARFSQTALLGAVLAPQFFIICATRFVMHASSWTQHAEATWWETLFEFGILSALLGIVSLVGTTILGWVAISQIRRSAGRVYGLALAVFDGLLFPLLAMSVLIWFILDVPSSFVLEILGDTFKQAAWNDIIRMGLIGLRIAIIIGVDVWIVSRVWREVRKPFMDSPSGNKRLEEAQAIGNKRAWWLPPRAWSKSREIAAHMTKSEYSAALKFGWWFGIWNAVTLFSPMAIVYFIPIPVPLNWIIAASVLMTGLAFYPLWLKKQARFLCSTAWAKQRSIEPAAVSMPLLGNMGMMLLGAILLLITGLLWWRNYEPAGVWLPALVERSISKRAGDISLRVTEVSQHKQIVLVSIVCERTSDSDKLHVYLSAPTFEIPNAIASETPNMDCLLSPDSNHRSGKVLAGANPFSAKSAIQIGYVLPDEQAAAQAVGLVRKFHLGQSRGLTRTHNDLPLFALRRGLGEDINGKPVTENIYASISWWLKTPSATQAELIDK